jgi:hypothetical protein
LCNHFSSGVNIVAKYKYFSTFSRTAKLILVLNISSLLH